MLLLLLLLRTASYVELTDTVVFTELRDTNNVQETTLVGKANFRILLRLATVTPDFGCRPVFSLFWIKAHKD